jgi:enamine deaminase RidA (YjgF/YER057c/UK114 family)
MSAYCHVVRIGPCIHVSTSAIDGKGDSVGLNDPYVQTAQCLRNIGMALAREGVSMADVVRMRVYVVNTEHQRKIETAYADVFRRFFSSARVEVRCFMLPETLVKIEIDAVVTQERRPIQRRLPRRQSSWNGKGPTQK